MRVIVVVVGRVKGPLSAAVAEYEKRARRYWRLEVVEVGAGGPGRSAPPEAVRAAEAERIIAKIPNGFDVVALTRMGSVMDSRELTAYLEGLGIRSSPGAAFVVGGAFGLGDAVLDRAARSVSLSGMTLPHEMARLLLAEQLYRAGTILRGEPYHKG